ncbi:MAG: hypothetical protein QOI42_2270 [Frankiaceae bacterium]|nr:hypothetical protein [Frankiaceae bacterium]
MTHQESLAALLSEFAHTMVTDFPIQSILDRLVNRIVDALPITGAGVTLISPGLAPHYIAASNEDALRFERLQTELGEGPCGTAYDTGEAVLMPDLRRERRFSAFTAAALESGLAACFTYPLRHNDGRLGALDLYRDAAGPLDATDMQTAQTLADVVAAYILNAQARDDARAASDKFRESSLKDPLTGLANRAMLTQRLEHAARRAERSHTKLAVLFADLDRFKVVNDTYGHQVGDDVLIQVARRLAGVVRPGDTLARVSGDEFVFLCEDLASVTDIEVLAARIEASFRAPFPAAGADIELTASIGMAYAGPGEAVTNQLIVDADIAMYQAKRNLGAAHQIIDVRQADQSSTRERLARDLRAAFAREELAIAYQPIVRPTDGALTGVEALLRWTHPDTGPVATIDMIAVAEANGLITPLGAWILDRACRDHVGWSPALPARSLQLAVNVSGRQLLGPGFVTTVADVLHSTGMEPASLVLEVTETVFVGDTERAVMVLRDLKALGVQLALDDFGTGYCALNYLRDFPVDIVKIDQSFIHDTSNTTGPAIVAAITHLAHVLGLTVIAEGVETEAQHASITEVGCDRAQGYLYASPMPAEQLQALLSSTAVMLPLPNVQSTSA